MHRKIFGFSCGVLLAGSTAACLPQTGGELDNGAFTYDCVGDTDLTCSASFFDSARVPEAIAVGAAFGMQYNGDTPDDSTGSSLPAQLVSADPALLDGDAKGFTFLAAGTSALLARTSSGVVVDFVHLTGADVAKIAVTDLGGPAEVITLGFGTTLEAAAKDDLGATLAGAITYAWTTSDEEIVSLSKGSRSSSVNLEPGKPGKATVTVSVGATKQTIAVTVPGAP